MYMGNPNPNPNVHLKSNATANEITKLIMIISLSSKVAALNKEICTPNYATNFS